MFGENKIKVKDFIRPERVGRSELVFYALKSPRFYRLNQSREYFITPTNLLLIIKLKITRIVPPCQSENSRIYLFIYFVKRKNSGALCFWQHGSYYEEASNALSKSDLNDLNLFNQAIVKPEKELLYLKLSQGDNLCLMDFFF